MEEKIGDFLGKKIRFTKFCTGKIFGEKKTGLVSAGLTIFITKLSFSGASFFLVLTARFFIFFIRMPPRLNSQLFLYFTIDFPCQYVDNSALILWCKTFLFPIALYPKISAELHYFFN